MTTRSHLRLLFWLVAFLVLYTLVAWSINDYTVCVSSQMVEVGKPAVVNPGDMQWLTA
jgi:hypothetical protein